jgi:hypothetical protein
MSTTYIIAGAAVGVILGYEFSKNLSTISPWSSLFADGLNRYNARTTLSAVAGPATTAAVNAVSSAAGTAYNQVVGTVGNIVAGGVSQVGSAISSGLQGLFSDTETGTGDSTYDPYAVESE